MSSRERGGRTPLWHPPHRSWFRMDTPASCTRQDPSLVRIPLVLDFDAKHRHGTGSLNPQAGHRADIGRRSEYG
jgi:hypothetical protein